MTKAQIAKFKATVRSLNKQITEINKEYRALDRKYDAATDRKNCDRALADMARLDKMFDLVDAAARRAFITH